MEPVGIRTPTSTYGAVRRAQEVEDASAAKLVEDTAQSAEAAMAASRNAPPAPIQVAPTHGSSIHVIA